MIMGRRGWGGLRREPGKRRGLHRGRRLIRRRPPGHVFFPWIEALFTRGSRRMRDEPPLYCPEQTVNRAEMAVFILRGIHGAGHTPPAASGIFADVPFNHPFRAWVEQLFGRGSRAAARRIPSVTVRTTAWRARRWRFPAPDEARAGYQPPDPTGIFADVPLNHPFARWIEQLAAEGITAGAGPIRIASARVSRSRGTRWPCSWSAR